MIIKLIYSYENIPLVLKKTKYSLRYLRVKFWTFCLFFAKDSISVGSVANLDFPNLICIVYADIYYINSPSILLYISQIFSQSVLKCVTF